MPDYKIRVEVDPRPAGDGTKKVNDSLDSVGRNADRVRGLIARAFAFTGVALSIRSLVNLADTFKGTQNALRTFIQDEQTLNAVTNELIDVANRAEVSFESVTGTFRRASLATAELGLSYRQLIDFTEGFQLAAKLSGASAETAESALSRLTRGLIEGTLGTRDLQTIFRELPIVAETLAKSLGVATSELQRLLEEGRIGADDVVRAFTESTEELRARVARTNTTVSESFAILRNEVIRYIGSLDQSTGATGLFAQGVVFLAQNLGTLARFALAAGVALGINFAQRGVGAAISAVNRLTVAIAANPIGAIATGIVLAVSLLTAFSDKIFVTGDGLTTLADLGVAAFEIIGDIIREIFALLAPLGAFVTNIYAKILNTTDISLRGFLTAWARTLDRLVGFARGASSAVVAAFKAIPEAVRQGTLEPIVAGMRQAFEEGMAAGENVFERSVDSMFARAEERARERAARTAAAGTPDLTAQGTRTIVPRARELTEFEKFIQNLERQVQLLQMSNRERKIQEALFSAEDALKRKLNATERDRVTLLVQEVQALEDMEIINDRIRALDNEISVMHLSNREREVAVELLGVEDQLKRKLTDSERTHIEERMRTVQLLKEEVALLDEIRGPQDRLIEKQATLNRLYADGRITAQEYEKALRGITKQMLDLRTDAESGFLRGMIQVQERFTDLASVAENTVVNAFQKAEDALVSFVRTGKFEVTDLVNSVLDDLTRLAVRQAIMAPLSNALGLGATQSASGGGGLADLFSFLPGFQRGADFTVGGSGGVDSKVVAFRASPGERVRVTPKGEGSGGNVVNFNISTPDANSFRASQGQLMARAATALNRSQQRNS